MSRGDYPKGCTLTGRKQGEALFIDVEAPMGRAMRRYLERNERLQQSREKVRSGKKGGKS